MRPFLLAITLVTAAALAACAGPAKDPSAKAKARAAENLSRLTEWMTGGFSNHDQAMADPEGYRDVGLHIAPIWPERTDGRWLYVEQTVVQAPEKPYSQRAWRLSAREDGVVAIDSYDLRGDPLKVAGQWRDPDPLKYLSPASLKPREGCTVLVRASGERVFEGGTDGTGCRSSLRGAAFMTTQIAVRVNELRTWERGFDENGAQVWGAEKGPYVFRKVAAR